MAMRPRGGDDLQPRPSMRPTYERPSMRPTYNRPSMRPTYERTSMRPTYDRPSMRPTYERTSMRPTYDRPSMRPTYERTSMRPTYDRPSMRPTSMRPIYESFKPRFEWKREDNDTILLLYLPGFVKEQLRTELDKSRGLLQIQGQRPLGAGRWSNFNQSFMIPPTGDWTQIDTRLELGVLTVTIPSQNVTAQPKTAAQQQQIPTATPQDGEETEETSSDVDDKNLDAMKKEETEETSSDDDHELSDLEKFDGKKEDKEANIIPDEKLLKAEEKDHMLKNGDDAEEKVKAKHIKHESDVEKKTMKSEEQVLLINMVIAAVVLMGLGAHIFSIFGTSKTP